MSDVWNSARVAEFAGITYRQLDFWVRSGYLDEPDRVSGGSGRPTERHTSGTRRRFTEADAWRARRMRTLVDGGMPVAEAGALVANSGACDPIPDGDVERYQQQIREARECLAGQRVEVLAWP